MKHGNENNKKIGIMRKFFEIYVLISILAKWSLPKAKCDRVFMKVILTHLMIAVYYFQFQSRALSSFLEWCVLIDENRPRYEVRRVFHQF